MYARSVLVVRPACFGWSADTAATNGFQQPPSAGEDVAGRGRAELDGVVAALRAEGVRVEVLEDRPSPVCPDAVFPNNWFSTHPDGTALLYPMAPPSRRAERRPEVVAALPGVRRLVDLSALEAAGAFLEGTGSLVMDVVRGRAWACRSPRTTDAGLDAWVRASGMVVHRFDAALDGAPVYHTNVLLALGPDWAVLGEELVHPADRAPLRASLASTGREVLPLSAAEVRAYAGNLLVLEGAHGPVTVASRTAADALGPRLARLGRVCVVDIPTLERVGGGSARCLLAELWTG